ncbi:MAG TPA: hypothetical protein VJO35_06595 [Terriglobales bacterium]|nr:hypothetical protein [Terriglobales bacterium]
MAKRASTAAQTAQLVYNNGPLITTPEVFTVFWGSGWGQASAASIIPEINGFFDYILTSSLMDQLAEYNVPKYKIGHGKRTGTLTLTNPDVSSPIDDSGIQQMIQKQISAGAFPASTPNAIYFVFLPSGVTVTQGGSESCKVFCGYHDATSSDVFYAVMPFPDCSGCASNFSTFVALTVTASHELCEAITDPIPGEGWYDNQNGEIGDICAWQTRTLGKYTIQKEWSNKSGMCV